MVEEEISESETRKDIDKQLKNAGWIEKYIKEEVNSVKSDFVSKEYALIGKKEEIEKGKDRFIDYLLLSENNVPLAVVETKRFSKDPEKGRIQARTYAKDIELQTHEKIPIFLSNSEKWIFIDQKGIERKVSGPFSQEDLTRRKELFKNEKDITKISINDKIIDRPKLVLNLKMLAEHIEQGNFSALIQMATGTGKTRLASVTTKNHSFRCSLELILSRNIQGFFLLFLRLFQCFQGFCFCHSCRVRGIRGICFRVRVLL